MPDCESVKLVNTPMAYSGMSRSTFASVASSTTMLAPARKMIPLENTSRCPRLVSWRGMKWSAAGKFASRGKSAKLVFAASTRMSSVPAWSEKKSDVAERARAVDELADLRDHGRGAALVGADVHVARPAIDRPRNITASGAPMMTSVVARVAPRRLP